VLQTSSLKVWLSLTHSSCSSWEILGALRSMRSGLASYTVAAPLPVLVSILGAGERRDHIVRVGGHRDHMIVTELDQCLILGIGLPDAADLRRVDNDRLPGRQFGELMELDARGHPPRRWSQDETLANHVLRAASSCAQPLTTPRSSLSTSPARLRLSRSLISHKIYIYHIRRGPAAKALVDASRPGAKILGHTAAMPAGNIGNAILLTACGRNSSSDRRLYIGTSGYGECCCRAEDDAELSVSRCGFLSLPRSRMRCIAEKSRPAAGSAMGNRPECVVGAVAWGWRPICRDLHRKHPR